MDNWGGEIHRTRRHPYLPAPKVGVGGAPLPLRGHAGQLAQHGRGDGGLPCLF